MEDRWLSVDDIAVYLGVSKDTIYTWVTSKGMPGHKVGRFWKFKKADVDAWVRTGGAASSSDDLVGWSVYPQGVSSACHRTAWATDGLRSLHRPPVGHSAGGQRSRMRLCSEA
jgi:excisionase family DNA binding protein